jgi:hypothetical protein
MKNSTIRKIIIIAIALIATGIIMDFNNGNYLTATIDTIVLALEAFILFKYFKD